MKFKPKTKNIIRNPFNNKDLKLTVYDIECYPNYFLCKFLTSSGKIIGVTHDKLPYLRKILNNPNLVLIGFNNDWYDDLLLKYIIYDHSVTAKSICEFSNWIINMGDKKTRDYWTYWNLNKIWYRSIDVMKIPKQEGGLKERGCSLHTRTIKDLPVAPNTELNPEQMTIIDKYCDNDLHNTLLIYDDVYGDIINRLELEKMYPGTDLVSKHDAGVCEHIMSHEYCNRNGMTKKTLKNLIPKPGQKLNLADTVPRWVTFKSPELNEVLNHIKKLSGSFCTKEQLKKITKEFEFRGTEYSVGAGGLHSNDKPYSFKSSQNDLLIEIDVDSFYPGLIRALDIRPTHMNQTYNQIVNEQTETRLKAKYAGDKVKAKALKIPILSNFGKTGSPYSVMYGELAQLQITIGGQLSLLMLIELLTDNGYRIVSANTDGVFLRISKNQLPHLRSIYHQWEKVTEQKLSEEFYSTYIRRDVNNYLGINSDNEVIKEKGVFKKKIKGTASIISKAAKAFFHEDIPVEQTVRNCDTITEFLFYFHCKKGWWMKHHRSNNRFVDMQPTTRWYVSKGVCLVEGKGFEPNPDLGDMLKFGTMTEAEQNRWEVTHSLDEHPNNWVKSEKMCNGKNSIILETLPDELPIDVDYDYYIQQAKEIIYSVPSLKKRTFKRR